WHPQYKFRAGKDKDTVQLEYLAAVVQQTGEDWGNVDLILSTAQPMLNAAPPDLKVLEVSLIPRGSPPMAADLPGGGPQPAAQPNANPDLLREQAKGLRQQAKANYAENNSAVGGQLFNQAAALEQRQELLATKEEDLRKDRPGWRTSAGE